MTDCATALLLGLPRLTSRHNEKDDDDATITVEGVKIDASEEDTIIVDGSTDSDDVTQLAVSDRPFAYPNVLVLPIGRRPLLPGIIHPFMVSPPYLTHHRGRAEFPCTATRQLRPSLPSTQSQKLSLIASSGIGRPLPSLQLNAAAEHSSV